MPDQPTDLRRTIALAGLLQHACRALAEEDVAPVDPGRRGDYAQNRWAAARFGPEAMLIHPDGRRAVPARELVSELAARTGADDLWARCEAERQLEVGRADGLAAVVRDLVGRTLGW
jgi:gamma-glutamyl:cysteine ligase YbdK (ATP-grasp superfamily)